MPQSLSENFMIGYNHTSGTNQRICEPCHTPHTNDTNFTKEQWNSQSSRTYYTLYQSSKDCAINGQAPISGASKLCLSCHDGTAANLAFGGGSASDSARASIGIDLRTDHPISINYAGALTRGHGYLRPLNYTVPDSIALSCSAGNLAVSDLLDKEGNVQCTSCHGAHANTAPYQLRITGKASRLCLACHNR